MKQTTSTTKQSEKNDAQTPDWFVNSLADYLGVSLDLDVCANKATSKCNLYYSLDESG